MSSQISMINDSRLANEVSQEHQAVITSDAKNNSTISNVATESIDRWTGEVAHTESGDPNIAGNPVPDSESTQIPQAAAQENSGLFRIIRKYASVSDLLRFSGAIAVAAAMGLFLLDGINVVNDLQRFLTMLGLTGALMAAGLLISTLLKEQRGSRVFISLALLSVPVNFTVIGALLYSVMPLDSLALNYPGYAHWQAGSASDLLLAVTAGLAVLVPVIWFGFSVLARSARNMLSLALITSCAILLVPLRGELLSSAMAIGTTLLLWITCRRYSSKSLALRTTEGKFAIALLFVAPIIVAVRSLFFYDVDGFLLVTLSVGFLVYCRQLLSSRDKPGLLSSALTLLTSAAILGVVVSSGDLLLNFLPAVWGAFSIAIVLLLLSKDLLRVSPNPVLTGVISFIFAATSIFVLVASAVFSSAMTLPVTLVLIAVFAYGIYFRAKCAALISGTGLLALLSMNASVLLWHAQSLWSAALATGWWGVAGIGVLSIIAGSMIDRAGTMVTLKAQSAKPENVESSS